MLSIGFVLLTHGNESQMLRLTETLSRIFQNPRIACHHDFSQSSLNRNLFPPNIHFVRDYAKTKWGSISLVDATLRALRLLYAEDAPDWFYLISGSDYPIKSAELIRSELERTICDAFMTQKRIDHRKIPDKSQEAGGGFDHPWYDHLGYQRYIGRSLPIPSWRHPHRGPAAGHIRILNPSILKPFHPFDEAFSCFSGDQWFAANARAAEYILRQELKPLLRYFKGRFPPDEAFFHTVLGNAPGLRICPEIKHYIQWDSGNHPRMIGLQDLQLLLDSKAHFARKFAAGSPVLDALDAYLGISELSDPPISNSRHTEPAPPK